MHTSICINIYMQYDTWVGPSMGKIIYLMSYTYQASFLSFITPLFPLHLYLAKLRLLLLSPLSGGD